MSAQAPHRRRPYALASIAAAALLLALAGCGQAADQAADQAAASDKPAATHSSEPTPTPEPTRDPDATYTGACDYQLAASLDDSSKLIGDVTIKNVGNIGVKVEVQMEWKQLGYEPINVTKFRRVKYGEKKTVRFHRDATGTEIDRLQSWITGHGYDAKPCTFTATMVDTFGPIHS